MGASCVAMTSYWGALPCMPLCRYAACEELPWCSDVQSREHGKLSMHCQHAHLGLSQSSLSVGGVELCTGMPLLVHVSLPWPQTRYASAAHHACRHPKPH